MLRSGIYKIVNPNGKIYIGQAKDLLERKRTYSRSACKAQRLLFNSLNKYGWNNHIFEIIEEIDFNIDKLNELEIKYIKEYNSYRGWSMNGLNLTTGGGLYEKDESTKLLTSKSVQRYHDEIGHSEKTKQKIADTLKGSIQSEETRKKRGDKIRLHWEKLNLKTPHSKYTRNQRKINAEQIRGERLKRDNLILELLKSGLEQKQIAIRFSVVPSVITQIKKRHGLQI